jgi:hypothetical protein
MDVALRGAVWYGGLLFNPKYLFWSHFAAFLAD